jgi:hypothetical protein
MSQLKIKVTAHQNYLIFEPLQFEKDNNLIPPGDGKIGTVLIDTGTYLGMSKEAVKNLKKIKKSSDDIGDVFTWKAEQGDCIAWLGPMAKLVNVITAESDKNGIIDIDYVQIPNKVPEAALDKIKNILSKSK